MTSRTWFWKVAVSVLALAVAWYEFWPLSPIPLERFAPTHVIARDDEFAKLHVEALWSHTDVPDWNTSPSYAALAGAIAGALNAQYGQIEDAFIVMFPPPPVQGLGTTGGFKLQLQDRGGLGYEALDQALKAFMAKAYQTPELAGLFSSYQVNVPQLYADLDRTRARQLGVAVTDVFDTMQIYLGSLYVNDFNKFGRTYRVLLQAESAFRSRPSDLGNLYVRTSGGDMIPLKTLITIRNTVGADQLDRYNGFIAAKFLGGAAPGVSVATTAKIAIENGRPNRKRTSVAPQGPVFDIMPRWSALRPT